MCYQAYQKLFHKCTKHIDVTYYFIRDKEKSVRIMFYPTDLQLAGIFTKPLPKEKFEKLRNLLNIKCV